MASKRGSAAPGRGILFTVLGGALLTMNDAVLKWLTGDYPVGQLLFIRGLFVLLAISVIIWRAGGFAVIRVNNVRSQALRSAFAFTSGFLFITGLGFLELADAIAITFAGPLFVTALASPLLGEDVGWRRWAAVGVGLFGVLVIIRPSGDAVQWAALLPLGASLFGTLRDITTRKISAHETSMAILCFSTIAVILFGLCTLPFGWSALTARDLGLMSLSGLFVGGAHFLLIERFHWAEAALLAPFKYVNMIWAVIFGFFIWGDLPDARTLFGAGFVVVCGLYIVHRETVRTKKRR